MVRPNPRYGAAYSYSTADEERDRLKFAQLSEKLQVIKDRSNNPTLLGTRIDMPIPSWFHNPPQSIAQKISTTDKKNWLIGRIEYLEALRDVNEAKCHAGKGGNQPYCDNWNENLAHIQMMKQELNLIKDEPISFPSFDILPAASAEMQIQQKISDQTIQIINDINHGVIQVPDWFKNNIDWVQSGQITEQEFLTAYNYIVDQQITHLPISEPTVNNSITDNMITQQIDYFTIENGRAIGQITFTATQNFNPFYYNKTITNLIQFKDRNGVNILPTVKQNNLRFTATERTETIRYDEGMKDNIYSKVSSFVWSSAKTPTAFSKQSEFEIREKEPVKPISSGFMAAGVAGAIAGLVLLGFIADHRGGK